MNFKIGQKVVCVDDGKPWKIVSTGVVQTGRHPQGNEIVTVKGFGSDGFLFLKEYSPHHSYSPKDFRALDQVAKGVAMTFEKLKDVQPIYQS